MRWTYLFSKLKSQCIRDRRLVLSRLAFVLSCMFFQAESRFGIKPFRVLRSVRISKISKIHLNTIDLIAFIIISVLRVNLPSFYFPV